MIYDQGGNMLLVDHIRENRVHHSLIGYAGAAWVILQVLDVLGDRWGLGHSVQRSIDLLVLIGLVVTATVAWFHGRPGPQRVTTVEALLLTVCGVGCLLVLSGAAAPLPIAQIVVVGDSVAEAPECGDPTLLRENVRHRILSSTEVVLRDPGVPSISELVAALTVIGEHKGPDLILEASCRQVLPMRYRVSIEVSSTQGHRVFAAGHHEHDGTIPSEWDEALKQLVSDTLSRGLREWRSTL